MCTCSAASRVHIIWSFHIWNELQLLNSCSQDICWAERGVLTDIHSRGNWVHSNWLQRLLQQSNMGCLLSCQFSSVCSDVGGQVGLLAACNVSLNISICDSLTWWTVYTESSLTCSAKKMPWSLAVKALYCWSINSWLDVQCPMHKSQHYAAATQLILDQIFIEVYTRRGMATCDDCLSNPSVDLKIRLALDIRFKWRPREAKKPGKIQRTM